MITNRRNSSRFAHALGATCFRPCRSVDDLVRQSRRLTAGEDPADDCRKCRHSQKQEEEIGYRNVAERGDSPVERITAQPTDHADVPPTTPRRAPRNPSAPAVTAVNVRRVLLDAPVAASVRRSLAVSLLTRPTDIPRTPRAMTIPKIVAELTTADELGSSFL